MRLYREVEPFAFTKSNSFEFVILSHVLLPWTHAGIYYPLIDEFGHCDGPDSKNLIGPMDTFDRGILKFILDEIKHKQLETSLDFVMFSDHGMINLNFIIRSIIW